MLYYDLAFVDDKSQLSIGDMFTFESYMYKVVGHVDDSTLAELVDWDDEAELTAMNDSLWYNIYVIVDDVGEF